jgi:hypothetical protein
MYQYTNSEKTDNLAIIDLETKETELQKTTTELQQHLTELHENKTYSGNLNPEVKQQNVISSDDKIMPQPENAINHPNENGIFPHHSRVETSSSRIVVFDTKDFCAQ